MLNIDSGGGDLFIALAGRVVSTLGDEVALVALTQLPGNWALSEGEDR
jgi:hypothetical protein